MIKTSTLLLALIFSTASLEAAAPKGLASFFEKASTQPQQENVSTMSKEQILKNLETEVKKEQKMDLLVVSQQLYAAGEYLDKNFDEAFLKSVLSFYPMILKKEMSHTLVEMFAESYKNNQKRFDSLLEESLNEEQRQDFKDRIQAAFYEQENGQG